MLSSLIAFWFLISGCRDDVPDKETRQIYEIPENYPTLQEFKDDLQGNFFEFKGELFLDDESRIITDYNDNFAGDRADPLVIYFADNNTIIEFLGFVEGNESIKLPIRYNPLNGMLEVLNAASNYVPLARLVNGKDGDLLWVETSGWNNASYDPGYCFHVMKFNKCKDLDFNDMLTEFPPLNF